MRRGRREKPKANAFKYSLFISGGIVLAVIITFVVVMITYNNKLKKASESYFVAESLTGLVPNTDVDIQNTIEDASSELSKTIEEALDDVEIENEEEPKLDEPKENENTNEASTEPVEEKKELKFEKPVEGEIMTEFAKEKLVFSETLQEWTTHTGIDIKADRTTVVKAAEGGTVASIKNDPRYGLTVIIEHDDGFKTVYSNLLTAEFVTEKEELEKGQSIGTVGNSAAFEIADEPHLHFEIIKDNENVDPTQYIKF